MNRREFLRRAGIMGAAAIAPELIGCHSESKSPTSTVADDQTVAIITDPDDVVANSAPAQWASHQLMDALQSRGIRCCQCDFPHSKSFRFKIVAFGRDRNLAPLSRDDNGTQRETCAVLGVPRESGFVIFANGNDSLGLAHALSDLADRVRYSPNPLDTLRNLPGREERPANAIRSVMRLFASDVEDKPWFNDRNFWPAYFDMLATNRFNRFNLALGLGYDNNSGIADGYFFFAYPFLVNLSGYKVRATGLSDGERDRNLQNLKFASDEAARRGLHFQLGIWTHAYQYVNSPRANFVIDGLTPDAHAEYCCDALNCVLQACPNISGVTFRIHGESGVPEGSYDFWKTVFDGIVRTGRKIEIDMHAKGMDQQMIDAALATGLPITISPKFWAEHMGLAYMPAAIREQEMPPAHKVSGQFSLSSGSRSFLRYSYGDLLKENRRYRVLHRIWPGTQRLLLWGDPTYAADYGRLFNFCGSDGVEIFDPLSFKGRQGSGLTGGRDGYGDSSLKPTRDWQKYEYTYRLWGRLTYNPDCDPEVWRRQLKFDWGDSADSLESALAAASRILPLITSAHCPSAANSNYWPEMYTNMSIVDASHPAPYSDTAAPKVFGNASPLDPQFFSTVNEFADSQIRGQRVAKVSPLDVAHYLEKWAFAAREVPKESPSDNAAIRRAREDIHIAAGLGFFFANKFRAAYLFRIFQVSANEEMRKQALENYRSARDFWRGLADAATAYVSDITFGPSAQLRGNWSDRLAAIDRDIGLMETAAPEPGAKAISELRFNELTIPMIISGPLFTPMEHSAPESFAAGQPLSISARLVRADNSASVELWYRQVDQSQRWVSTPTRARGSTFSGEIPAEYTNSQFPIQYYFEVIDATGYPRLFPGFREDFRGQAYFVVRPSAS